MYVQTNIIQYMQMKIINYNVIIPYNNMFRYLIADLNILRLVPKTRL